MFNKDSLYFRQAGLLVKTLPFIAKETDFALKGGTAINLFIQDTPRLSIDIDLTYLPVKERKESLEGISAALERIADDIEKHFRGSRMNRIQQKENSDIFGTAKLIVNKDNMNIKIEPSTVLRGSLRGASVIPMVPSAQDLFGYAELQVVHRDDLYAGKLCAALDRQHPRDFFDIKCLIYQKGISDELMEVFLIYLLSSNQPIVKLLRPHFINIKETFERQFVGMTREPITVEELEKTREDLVFLINQRLSDRHKEFLIGFKEGNPNWNLIQLKGIAELPAIKWKMINLKRMDVSARRVAVKKLSDALDYKPNRT